MHTKIALAAPLAAVFLLGAGAADGKAPVKRQCFNASQVSNFAAADEHAVNLRVGVRDVWQLEMFGPCHDVDWSQAIGIRSRGSSFICSGLDAELITRSALGPQRCQVKTVRKLTPEEVTALPGRGRP